MTPVAGSSDGSVLEALAASLRRADGTLAGAVAEPVGEAALGALVASGPRVAGAPDEYALMLETIREGYLLHFGEPRVVRNADPDLALLAGDYLYARGLERVAALGDLEAVRELSDLVSLCAQIHAEDRSEGGGEAAALWLASAVAIACGASIAHRQAKLALRNRDPGAAAALWRFAEAAAAREGLAGGLRWACETVGFGPPEDH